MERMKHTGDYELDTINMLEQECSDLEEENKKLREELNKYNEMEKHIEDGLLTPIPNVWSHEEEIRRLKIENKKLKEILNRIKELYEDEEEAELLNYLDEILDEILD